MTVTGPLVTLQVRAHSEVLEPHRVLRGRSAALARQEAWALLLVQNMIAAMAARAAAAAGTGLAAVSFTAVLSLVRDHVAADACCRHCGQRPTSGGDPLAQLTAAIAAQPLTRQDRKRTSGRTTAEREKWPTEEATYDLTIVPSTSRKQTQVRELKGSGFTALWLHTVTEQTSACAAIRSMYVLGMILITALARMTTKQE
jgi:hypothetical protein